MITRPGDAGGEDFDGVSEAAFDTQEAARAFALSWCAHGLCYGIPDAVDAVLSSERDVLANLSRSVLIAAQARFARVEIIALMADHAKLAERLHGRGRETGAEITLRPGRAGFSLPQGCMAHVVDNDGALDDCLGGHSGPSLSNGDALQHRDRQMTDKTILANARLILQEEVILGSLCIKDGVIREIASGAAVPTGARDMQGDFVAPGLVELHTDNLERHLAPRPKVDWPHRAAIVAHDRELAGTGITTVFDAIRVGSIQSRGGRHYGKYARLMADEILSMRAAGTLRISHHLHLRAEICSETLIEELDEFGPADRVGIVSMMDHTPGQRQFSDMQKYKDYVCGKHGLDPAELDGYVAFLRGLQDRYSAPHEAATAAAAARYGATLASHDDTTTDQVAASHGHGVTLAEFPTTLAAAEACHAHGIGTIMGAPNLIRGDRIRAMSRRLIWRSVTGLISCHRIMCRPVCLWRRCSLAIFGATWRAAWRR